MDNQKKILRLVLLVFFPIFLTVLFIGPLYLFTPVCNNINILEQIGLCLLFYLLFLIIFGFVYAYICGWGRDKVLTNKDHKRNFLIAFVISLILIGIFIVGLVNTNYNISTDNIFGLFQIWIFLYLIPLVAIEFLTWVWKVKKKSS